MLQAGQNWAQQQIDNLLKPSAPPAPPPPSPVAPQAGPLTPDVSAAIPPPPAPGGPSGAISGDLNMTNPSDRVRGQADLIRQASASTGVPSSVIAGIMDTEAGGPNSVSPAGAMGFMQVMPQHFQPGENGLDPATNIQRGAEILRDNYQRYGSWDKAAAAYFGAIDSSGNILGGAQDARGTSGSTYVSKFQNNLQNYQSGAALMSAPPGNTGGRSLSDPNAQSTSGGPSGQQWLKIAEDQLSKPYIWGSLGGRSDFSQNPAGFDCSGFVSYVMKTGFGVDLPAFTGTAYAQTRALGKDEQPRPGDVVFYNMNSGDPHEQHIALYIGNGQIIQAGGTRQDVNIASANQPVGSAPEYRRPTALDNVRGNDLAQSVVGNIAQQVTTTASEAGRSLQAALTTPGNAQSQGPLTMGTMQPAAQTKAQDVMNAVQDVGGQLPDITGALSPRATDLTSLLTPPSRPPTPPSRDLGADLPDITGLLTVAPTTPLGRMVAGEPIGQMSPSDQAQALMQWNQQYELARATGTQNLTGNLPVISGLASFATDPEQILALAAGGGVGKALLPGAGLLPSIGRQALTGGISGGLFGAQQPSASAQDILLNAAFGGGLGGAGGALGPVAARLLGRTPTAELPGVLQQLERPGPSEPIQYSARGIALDPLTGNEVVPPGQALTYGPHGMQIDPITGQEMVPVTEPINRLAAAQAATPEATQFMRTTSNQFEPIVPQAPMEGDDLLNAMRSILQGRDSGEVNAAVARALGGGAAGGLAAYKTTDENDPNRWLKVAGGVGAGALAAGPGVDLAMQLASNPAVRSFVTDEGGGLDLQRVRQLVGGSPIGRTIQAARVGSLAGGIPTLSHIALNMPVQTALKLANDLPASIATGHFEAAPMEVYGALQGLRSWALNAANELRQPGPYAKALGGGTGAQLAETGLTGLVRLHPVLQDMAGQMAKHMDLWSSAAKEATNAGFERFSPDWNAEVARLVANPTQAMTDSATAASERASLNTPLGTTGEGISKLVQKVPLARFFLPIFNKGYAIATQGVETSPLGLAGTAWDVLQAAAGRGPYAGAEGFAGRGAAGAVTPLAQRLRNNMIGIGLAYEGYKQAEQGNITGEGPADPKEQALLRETGWQPDSIRIFGRYFDAHLLGPVGWSLIQGANAYEATQGVGGAGLKPIETPQGLRAPNALDIAGDLVARQGRYFNNETFLSSLGSALNLIGSSAQQGQMPAREAASVLESLIPQGALLSNLASTTDPYARVAQGATPLEQIQRSVESRLPGYRQSLPPRLDVTGQPIPNPQQGAGLLLPRSNVVNPNPVALAMAGAGVTPGAAPKEIPFGPTAKILLTPDEQQAWQQYRGNLMQQAASGLVNSPQFAQLDTLAQNRALTAITQNVDAAATGMVMADLARTPDFGRRMIGTGALAPVYGYAPIDTSNQLTQTMMLRNQLHHQALMNALVSGQSGVQASLAGLAA
jgi:cell wall-associated NlpC family hydrolase